MENYCIIMAGGSGSRFWPYSLESKPKQFLDILGTGKTLLQQTFERANKLFDLDKILIVTNELYGNLVHEQIPMLLPSQILLEPFKRNTAPCLVYAIYKIMVIEKEANIVVVPSDHLILNEPEFLKTLRIGLHFTSQHNSLLTLGIKPSRPDTGYGYIQIDNENTIDNINKVKTFTEKPDKEMAQIFLESGEFFWNSGIFIWSLKSIKQALKELLPDIYDAFGANISVYHTEEEKSFIQRVYAESQNISIDYGIMEKSENVYVLCSEFGWSDLGTWGSLYENSSKDTEMNALSNSNVLLYNSKNNIIKSETNKLIVVQGLDNYIIVETEKSLLICNRNDEQQIRQIVNDIKLKKGSNYINS